MIVYFNKMMPLKELDVNKLSRLILPHVDQATCLECCKLYLVPTTAPCGHSLCRSCWSGRKNCATCGVAVDRKTLKLNLQLQKITEHTHNLRQEYEKIFSVELDELSLDTLAEKQPTKDPTKHVREWLANSENQFTAPEISQQSTQDFCKQQQEIGSKSYNQRDISKTNFTKVHVGVSQDDWDKIEEMPDTEDLYTKSKENPIGPMDIEPFVVNQCEFSSNNPRRSCRKLKGDAITDDISSFVDKYGTTSSKYETNPKVLKNKQKWANVNRMKKEFSKLNKKYNNKLNVSIEMCKKTQYSANKNMPIIINNDKEDMLQNIDEITPNSNPKDSVDLNLDKDKLNKNNQFRNDELNIQKDGENNAQFNQPTKHTMNNINMVKGNLSKTSESPNSNNDKIPVPFFMKGALQPTHIAEDYNSYNNNQQHITVDTDKLKKSNEDIEITIKIGNTSTKIFIKKKEEEVQFKINAERENQTYFENECLNHNKKDASCSPVLEVQQDNNLIINTHSNNHNVKILSTIKPTLSKKNTDSADTATAQYEITESIEKELSKDMIKENTQRTKNINKYANNMTNEEDCFNDLDLFDNNSMKVGNVHTLQSLGHPPSEILISTIKSKQHSDKRVRDITFEDLPISKKRKVIEEESNISEEIGDVVTKSKQINEDSEVTNYDVVMGQVFANIDLDLENKSDERKKQDPEFVKIANDRIVTPPNSNALRNICDSIHGESENVFSLNEKENDCNENYKKYSQHLNQLPSENALSSLNKEAAPAEACCSTDFVHEELSTPVQNMNDGSDESIVEETPQKNTSLHKVKQKSIGSGPAENAVKRKALQLKRSELGNAQKKSSNSVVINISDITDNTLRNSEHVTVVQGAKSRPTLETPLTITKFVDQIKHKSTPVAKKSLNFDKENTEVCDVDPEQTLCPSSFLVARTTQEREFMTKAFEDSSQTRAKSPLVISNQRIRTVRYCLAGSCLTPSEITNIKILCSLRNWDYTDKYTNDITHLVVGVDEENKSQRSVKYMCALAGSKWIVSYEWVQKCLEMKEIVDEEPYEALDGTGEPGPRRSRVAKQKLFQGITFFCMAPFSVLDVDTLKTMLEAAGGQVVDEARAVRVTSGAPALLLAEPEHTQEDRFIYLAMELSIVPVNYEWVLNCLGSYTISSVQELLLCPASLLPSATAQWPQALMAKEYD